VTGVARSRFAVPFSIMVSAFGFFTVLALTAYSTGPTETVTWRKPIVGSIFALICFLGILLAMSPRKCSETFGHQERMKATASSLETSNLAVSTKGHHYACSKFSGHTVEVNEHVVCAACTGLLLGGIGGLLGSFFYFFAGWTFPQNGSLTVVIGVVAMTFGFLQLKFGGFARLVLNMFFVLGAFLILTGLDYVTGSLFVDLFSIVLIVFWLFTRILFSQWDHWRICRACSASCEIWGKRKVGSISSAQPIEGTNYD
jgi:hypothetical protein